MWFVGDLPMVGLDNEYCAQRNQVEEHEGRSVDRREIEKGYPNTNRDSGKGEHETAKIYRARYETTTAIDEMRATTDTATFVYEPTVRQDQFALARFNDSKHKGEKFKAFFWYGRGVKLIPVHSGVASLSFFDNGSIESFNDLLYRILIWRNASFDFSRRCCQTHFPQCFRGFVDENK
jgi:hypothetical protein